MFFYVMMIQYVGLRYLNEKREIRDPFLGRRFSLHVLLNWSIFLTLVGVNTLLFALVEMVIGKENGSGKLLDVWLRIGAAITFAGGMYVVLLIVLLALFLQDAKHKTVHHSFVILRFMISGAVVMAITTLALISVFSSSDKGGGPTGTGMLSFIISVFLVWVPLALIHFIWLRILLLKKKTRKQELAY